MAEPMQMNDAAFVEWLFKLEAEAHFSKATYQGACGDAALRIGRH